MGRIRAEIGGGSPGGARLAATAGGAPAAGRPSRGAGGGSAPAGLARGIPASLALHGAVFAFLFLLGTHVAPVTGPIVVDLTVGDGGEAAFAPPAPAPAASRLAATRPGLPLPPATFLPAPAAAAPPEPLPPPPDAVAHPPPDPPPAARTAEPPPAVAAAPVPPAPAATADTVVVSSPAVAASPSVPAATPGPPVAGASAAGTAVPIPSSAPPGAGVARSAADAPAGGIPGGETAAAGARGQYVARHFAYIRDTIQRRITYPVTARRMGWQGKVVVAFTVRKDGTVGDLRLVAGSGHSLLDRNALEAVRASSPFPRPPVEAEVVTPIVYTLSD